MDQGLAKAFIAVHRSEMLHEAVDQSQLPSELVHGTAEKHLKTIYKEGLKPGGNARDKNHNHLVESIQEKGDQPGIRNGSEVAVHIDTTQAEAKGIQFWQSKTGVFLTRQTIPPDMIVGESKIVNKTKEKRKKIVLVAKSRPKSKIIVHTKKKDSSCNSSSNTRSSSDYSRTSDEQQNIKEAVQKTMQAERNRLGATERSKAISEEN